MMDPTDENGLLAAADGGIEGGNGDGEENLDWDTLLGSAGAAGAKSSRSLAMSRRPPQQSQSARGQTRHRQLRCAG